MINTKYLHSEITEKIIGCAMKVHNKLGNGFREEVYQKCLAIEMNKIGLKFEREKDTQIYYDEFKVGSRRVDFLVENKVVIETKAIKKLEPGDWAQAINNLEASKIKIGLLINFGSKKLEFKRFINSDLKKSANKSVVN